MQKEKKRKTSSLLTINSKSMKPQHLNKSRLHLTRRGTRIQLTNFDRETSNCFRLQYLLHSPNTDQFTVTGCYKSVEYKPKVERNIIEANHLKNIQSNLSNFYSPTLI